MGPSLLESPFLSVLVFLTKLFYKIQKNSRDKKSQTAKCHHQNHNNVAISKKVLKIIPSLQQT